MGRLAAARICVGEAEKTFGNECVENNAQRREAVARYTGENVTLSGSDIFSGHVPTSQRDIQHTTGFRATPRLERALSRQGIILFTPRRRSVERAAPHQTWIFHNAQNSVSLLRAGTDRPVSSKRCSLRLSVYKKSLRHFSNTQPLHESRWRLTGRWLNFCEMGASWATHTGQSARRVHLNYVGDAN